jgi:hypothetical protein
MRKRGIREGPRPSSITVGHVKKYATHQHEQTVGVYFGGKLPIFYIHQYKHLLVSFHKQQSKKNLVLSLLAELLCQPSHKAQQPKS